MVKVQPFRGDTLSNPTAFRIRLNDMVQQLNSGNGQFSVHRFPAVASGQTVSLANPGFQVGAVVLGGVIPVNGATALTAAPWVQGMTQTADGSVQFTVGGLPASTNPDAPNRYAVNVVLFESGSAQ